jgi:hypothetical protein
MEVVGIKSKRRSKTKRDSIRVVISEVEEVEEVERIIEVGVIKEINKEVRRAGEEQ